MLEKEKFDIEPSDDPTADVQAGDRAAASADEAEKANGGAVKATDSAAKTDFGAAKTADSAADTDPVGQAGAAAPSGARQSKNYRPAHAKQSFFGRALDFFTASRKRSVIALCTAAAILLAAVGAAVIPSIIRSNEVPRKADPIKNPTEPSIEAPDEMLAVYLKMGLDVPFGEGWEDACTAAVESAHALGFKTLIVPAFENGKAIYLSGAQAPYDGNDYLKGIVAAAHRRAMTVFITADPLAAPDGEKRDLSDTHAATAVASEISDICEKYDVDGVVLTPFEVESSLSADEVSSDSGDGSDSSASSGTTSASSEPASDAGSSDALDNLPDDAASSAEPSDSAAPERAVMTFVADVAKKVRSSAKGACVGVLVSPDAADTAGSLSGGTADFILVGVDKPSDFESHTAAFGEKLAGKKPVYYTIDTAAAANAAISASDLVDQCDALLSKGTQTLVFNSLTALISGGAADFTELKAFILSLSDESSGIRTLSITSPSAHEFTTYSDSVTFIGASDPNEPLLVNGAAVERTDTGYFSVTFTLKKGKNTFTFEHKGTTQSYTVRYDKVMIKAIYPSEGATYNGGASVTVGVVALEGCTVRARLSDRIVTMTSGAATDSDEKFVTYTAEFTLPEATASPQELGALIVTASRGKDSETKSGGRFTVRGLNDSSSSNSDDSGSYDSGYGIEVGKGERYVCEVSRYQSETLDIINPTDERSRPTNAMLPQGTVDYCDDRDSYFYNPETGKTHIFRNLRYGKRIYAESNVKIFKATLPETNTVKPIAVSDDGRHTKLTFSVDWKAPFNVTLAPQSYVNPYPSSGRPNYAVSAATYEYVDIEFCYTAAPQEGFEFNNNPVFSRAEWVKCSSGCYALRLWLRTAGQFYGWQAEYNSRNQLEFSFLDPYQATPSPNRYGWTLKGAVIMIDPGHGGSDVGAVGSSKQYTEAVLNLILSQKIRRELENLGATVIMTRSDDSKVSLNDRNRMMLKYKPDIFVSVHRNSSTAASPRGYEDYYYYPFSKALADCVAAQAKSNFTIDRGTMFYPYQVTRVASCPSILTENGFVSNVAELELIKSEAHNEALATSTVQGIVNYFASIKQQ